MQQAKRDVFSDALFLMSSKTPGEMTDEELRLVYRVAGAALNTIERVTPLFKHDWKIWAAVVLVAEGVIWERSK